MWRCWCEGRKRTADSQWLLVAVHPQISETCKPHVAFWLEDPGEIRSRDRPSAATLILTVGHNISLRWMVEQLRPHYDTPQLQRFINNPDRKPDPEGLADLSVSAAFGVFRNHYFTCHDRTFPSDITYHDSVEVRKHAGLVPWLYYDKMPEGAYSNPSCLGKVSPSTWIDSTDGSKSANVLCIKQSNISCNALGF